MYMCMKQLHLKKVSGLTKPIKHVQPLERSGTPKYSSNTYWKIPLSPMMTSMKSARMAIFSYLHVAHDHTASFLVESWGTQNSGDGELWEFEKEQNIFLHFFMVQYASIPFFSFVSAQPQQINGYRSYSAFSDIGGWSDSSYWLEPKLSLFLL